MEENRPTRRRWLSFSLRTLFVFVTVVCVVAGLAIPWWQRSVKFRELERSHRQGSSAAFRLFCYDRNIRYDTEAQLKRLQYWKELSDYHDVLADKYLQAAKFPLWRVEPDPPPPPDPK